MPLCMESFSDVLATIDRWLKKKIWALSEQLVNWADSAYPNTLPYLESIVFKVVCLKSSYGIY